MNYPKTIYKNVLLFNGKMVNFKIGTTHWKTVKDACNNTQPLWIYKHPLHKLSVESVSIVVYNNDENNKYFEDNLWFKQFPIHEGYLRCMNKPY